ncbi:hypothetical protein ACLOJK_006313 [Asimina triloba]
MDNLRQKLFTTRAAFDGWLQIDFSSLDNDRALTCQSRRTVEFPRTLENSKVHEPAFHAFTVYDFTNTQPDTVKLPGPATSIHFLRAYGELTREARFPNHALEKMDKSKCRTGNEHLLSFSLSHTRMTESVMTPMGLDRSSVLRLSGTDEWATNHVYQHARYPSRLQQTALSLLDIAQRWAALEMSILMASLPMVSTKHKERSSPAKHLSLTGFSFACEAAVAYGPEEPLVIEEVRVDPPQKMEARIKIICTSICHTDLSAWKGENVLQRAYPRILGHEAAGIVESVGEGVSDLKAGDHVVPIFTGECQDCRNCNSGKTNLCEKYRVNPLKSVMLSDGKSRFSTKQGKPIYHFLNTSTFSEYTVLDSGCVVKISPHAPLKKMSLLSCGVSTGVGAAWNTADVQPGSTVAVFGLGAVGLAVAEGARLRGASRIIGVDINPEKFEKGKSMGVTDFVDPNKCKKPVHEEIKAMVEGGVEYSFECAGNLDVLREAFLSTREARASPRHFGTLVARIGNAELKACARGWGLTVILGIHPTPRLLPFHPMELFEGRRLVGCVFGGFKGKTQLPAFADQCIKMGLNLDGFITHELPFSEINLAFQLLIQGKSLRCLLNL